MMSGEKTKRRNRSISSILSGYYTDFFDKPYTLFRLILMLVAVLLISFNWYFFDRYENYGVGRPANRTYFAVTSSRYEDKAATLELRRRAAARITDVMVRNEKISAEVTKKLELLKEGEYSQVFAPPLIELFGRLSSASQGRILREVSEIGLEIRDSSGSREQQSAMIWNSLKKSQLLQSEQNVAFQILDSILNPTLQSDLELTARLKEDVATQIPPVVREIHTGSVLVQKGQVVTPSLAKLLSAQGYPDSTFPLKKVFFILIAIMVWCLWPIWIESGLEQKLTYREWVYIAVVLSLSWLLEVVFARVGGIPMSVLGMTGWLCLTLPVSISYHLIFGGGVISSMIAFGVNPGYVALAAILSSFSAGIGRILFKNPPNHRFTIWRNLFLVGVGLGGISVIAHWGMGMYFTYTLPISSVMYSAIWGTIVVALLPFWEYMFDVISPLRLLELSHPSQPIIKRLQLEAPGTYHHTLMVGTLAEAAADKLGMNGLLVKAGAYYHDIGKLKNPRFFVENQLAGENIHDELSPTLSALVIISHVKEGLEIAEEIKLPKTLRRFISEHHGTTIQKYFYDKAKSLDDSLTEEQFRYPGPSPQSKETALVMLADSVEAAMKARTRPFDSVREMQILVNSVLKSKIDAEQFEGVDFTIRDLAVIKDCFIEVFRSMYHSREVKELELPKHVNELRDKAKKEGRAPSESGKEKNEVCRKEKDAHGHVGNGVGTGETNAKTEQEPEK